MGNDLASYFEACELPGLHCMEFSELGIGLDTTVDWYILLLSGHDGIYQHRSYWESIVESDNDACL